MRLKLRTSRLVMAATAALILTLAGSNGWTQEVQPADPAQIARGAKAWAETCNRCHNLRDPKELVDYEWHVSVTHMRIRGNLPGDLARDILAFLKASN